MIKVKHPVEKSNRSQEQFLASCSEESRRFHELMFSFGNAAYIYHNQSASYEPTKEDFNEWLEGLPKVVAEGMRKLGFEECKTHFSFSRYVMEKNDQGMEEYVRNLMGDEDYQELKAMTNGRA